MTSFRIKSSRSFSSWRDRPLAPRRIQIKNVTGWRQRTCLRAGKTQCFFSPGYLKNAGNWMCGIGQSISRFFTFQTRFRSETKIISPGMKRSLTRFVVPFPSAAKTIARKLICSHVVRWFPFYFIYTDRPLTVRQNFLNITETLAIFRLIPLTFFSVKIIC